ncbi:hypothetical protein [Streptomyces sp. NBC_01618]|nr:hypothetical protein OH735_32675 [Streptomyces sp. NBC_01618]
MGDSDAAGAAYITPMYAAPVVTECACNPAAELKAGQPVIQ